MFADETQLLQSSLSRLEKQLQLASLAEAKKVEQYLTGLLETMKAKQTPPSSVDATLRKLLQSLAELPQRIDTLQEELLLAHSQDPNSLLH